jgi:hypothetical protein
MDETLSETQSFIVRAWVEEPAEGIGWGIWRGHITHVPSGRRHYLKNLGEIESFVAPYLEKMGMKLGMRWHMRH